MTGDARWQPLTSHPVAWSAALMQALLLRQTIRSSLGFQGGAFAGVRAGAKLARALRSGVGPLGDWEAETIAW